MPVKMYDWVRIKEFGHCAEYLKQIGTPVEREEKNGLTRFRHPPWRPESDSKGFVAGKEGFHDYAKDEKGSILDACARAEFNGDIWQAQQRLGEFYGLNPSNEKVKERRKIVAAYDYRDMNGTLLHQTVRFDPKEFSQRRPDPEQEGEWIWSLKDIEPVLYRMADWINEGWVCVVGGEKDADNLLAIGVPATTNPMGEGNWRKSFNKHFRDKKVVIIPDNDQQGENHALEITKNLQKPATELRVLRLPNLPHKGDVSDWLETEPVSTMTQEQQKKALSNLIRWAKQPSDTEDKSPLETAKRENQTPFTNYRTITRQTTTSKKEERIPVQINELLDDIHRRFMNFPRRIGNTLFDHDKDNDEIRYIKSHIQLFSWIQEKSKQVVRWGKMEGAVSQEQLFQSLSENAPRYEMISATPSWPARENVYYTFKELPEPSEGAKKFYEFCDFFCPNSEVDRLLIEAFVASPLYYEQKINRPLWVIDSAKGQGVGKTKLAEMVAYLYGGSTPESCEPLWINMRDMGEQSADRSEKRLLSQSGREKHMVIIDNVEGFFKCQRLVQWITQGSISGMAPYGRGEETRPNDLTYVITSNSATLDRDLIVRSLFIELDRPKNNKGWVSNIKQFIDTNRLQILADIKSILDGGIPEEISESYSNKTRYEEWERYILCPIVRTFDNYNEAIKQTRQRQYTADGEMEDAERIREVFVENIENMKLNPEEDIVWLHSQVLVNWTQQAIPGFGGRFPTRNTPHILRNFAKSNMIRELSDTPKIYPFSGKGRKRGMMWNEHLRTEETSTHVHIISTKGEEFFIPEEF